MATKENDMVERQPPRWRVYLIALVILAEVAHLAWEYFNGGVLSHHFLNRRDMPAISNGWGLFLLPVLTWFLSGRTQKRVDLSANKKTAAPTQTRSIIAGFTGSLIIGILLSISFANHNEDAAAFLFFGMIVLAPLLPIYRAECLLGFVLGMTFTFGAVLPALIGSAIAALSAVAHLLLYPFAIRFWSRIRSKR